jgi:thiol:disulfide interchange protein DsbA
LVVSPNLIGYDQDVFLEAYRLKIGSGKKKMGYGLAMIAVGISIMAIANHVSRPSSSTVSQSFQSIPKIDTGADAVEFFWYGCTHCKNLEQSLRDQQFHSKLHEIVRSDGSQASFQRVPATLNPLWTLHARLYFALDNLGMSDKGHFNTMKWIGSAMPKTSEQIYDVLYNEILPVEVQSNPSFSSTAREVTDLMFSTRVDNQIAEAQRLAEQAGITGVPTFVVDGTQVLPLGQGLDYQTIGPAVLSLLSPASEGSAQ